MSLSEENLQFGSIAVEAGLLTRDQLSDALMAQMSAPDKSLGAVLIEMGAMTQPKVLWVLERVRASQGAPAAAVPVATPVAPGPAPVPQAAPAPVATAVALEQAPAPSAGLTEAAPLPALEVQVNAAQAAAAPEAAAPAAQNPTVIPLTTPPPAPAVPVPATPAPAAAPAAPLAAAAPVATVPTEGVPDQGLARMVQVALSNKASDLHLHATLPAKVRINGSLQELEGGGVITDEGNKELLGKLLDGKQLGLLEEKGQIDFALSLGDFARLRCNAYRTQRGTDVVFRMVSKTPPTLEELGLPDTLKKLANYSQGIVLFTGPTGCGKSSTLAAMVDLINESKPDHILTVEDPIEYLHTSKRCVVNQRQVQSHTESFARSLRAALREDPDVIVIGELRDLETISLALTAAETGHVVLATMHTLNTIATINRLIGAFPPDEQSQIRTMVSESLRAVVSQRLVSKADGTGRVPAIEVLIANMAISNLIREQKVFQIPGMLQSGVSKGMCLLDMSLAQLVQSGTITREEALRECDNEKAIPGK